MRRFALPLSLFAVPALAFALDFSGTSLPYPDVPAGTPQAAGISLLTAEGVVSGYPDGTFRPEQTLNRAEFLKIVLQSHPGSATLPSDSADCFPDVHASDWFSRYVCKAKADGIIGGYPDGTFKPAQNVNYAEALKILSELYGYALPEPTPNERWAWYTPYVRAAGDHGTALPIDLAYDAYLTRGQMARLAAAFMAEDKGSLDAYRAAERGEWEPASSSSSVSSVGSGSSSSESSTSVSSSSVAQTSYTLPVASAFLLLGKTSAPLAGGVLPDRGEEQIITFARVRLFQEVTSIESIELIQSDGTVLATLPRKNVTSDAKYKRTYEIQLTSLTGPKLTSGDHTLFVRAKLKVLHDGGVSNQLLQVDTIEVKTYGAATSQTFSTTISGPFAQHQTALAHVTRVTSVSAPNGALMTGTGVLLGSFKIDGMSASGDVLKLSKLVFSVDARGQVQTSNWYITTGNARLDCTVGLDGVSCADLTSDFMDAVRLQSVINVYANVLYTDDGAAASLQVSLGNAGSPTSAGSVWWSDGIGTFKWVELPSPLAAGPRLSN